MLFRSRWAGWNIGPVLQWGQRGLIARSRGLTSPGSYQRSASATRSSLPDRGHAGRRRVAWTRGPKFTCPGHVANLSWDAASAEFRAGPGPRRRQRGGRHPAAPPVGQHVPGTFTRRWDKRRSCPLVVHRRRAQRWRTRRLTLVSEEGAARVVSQPGQPGCQRVRMLDREVAAQSRLTATGSQA